MSRFKRSVYFFKKLWQTIDLELTWTERWKSLLTTFTYDAFPLWNRTNLSIVAQGISYPGTEFMQIPAYTSTDLENLVMGQEVPASSYTIEPFHNGGDTGGTRPRRINYPNSERTNNGVNLEDAMSRQISNYGQAGSGSHFVTTRMWISKK